MRYSTGYCLLLSMMMMSCSSSDDDTEFIGNWMHKVDYAGVSRSEAVSFTINDTVFVGTGYAGAQETPDRLNDFYSYDAERNTWTQRAALPENARRSGAVGFGANGKGYIGTGYDGVNYLNDFYEYNPDGNTWVPIEPLPVEQKRMGAVAFTLNNNGYVATGYNGSYLNDTWEFNTTSRTWQKKATVTNSKRRYAVAFVIAGKAYIATGYNNLASVNELSMYDAATDSWTLKRATSNVSDEDYDDDYTSISGEGCSAFVMNNKAYVCTSTSGIVWEYDAVNDLWDQKESFEGVARSFAVGFGIKNRGFITTGRSGSTPLSDTWEFDPFAEQTDND